MTGETGATPASGGVTDHPEVCYYYDYRNPPGHPEEYGLKEAYWHVLAARLAFVVVFQNVVNITCMLIK